MYMAVKFNAGRFDNCMDLFDNCMVLANNCSGLANNCETVLTVDCSLANHGNPLIL